MPTKTKMTQKEDLEKANGRDCFSTPNYAVDLIIPFLDSEWYIWECAAGSGKIVNRFKYHGFNVIGSEIDPNSEYQTLNFLTDLPIIDFRQPNNFCIVTNPPFSLKKKFYLKCMEYSVPFALLIPSDISGWVLSAFDAGCQVIVPDRRIDYITPNIVGRINNIIRKYPNSLKNKKEISQKKLLTELKCFETFTSMSEIPVKVLREFSSSDFHSWWLTKGLNLKNQINIVKLSNDEKDNI